MISSFEFSEWLKTLSDNFGLAGIGAIHRWHCWLMLQVFVARLPKKKKDEGEEYQLLKVINFGNGKMKKNLSSTCKCLPDIGL